MNRFAFIAKTPAIPKSICHVCGSEISKARLQNLDMLSRRGKRMSYDELICVPCMKDDISRQGKALGLISE